MVQKLFRVFHAFGRNEELPFPGLFFNEFQPMVEILQRQLQISRRVMRSFPGLFCQTVNCTIGKRYIQPIPERKFLGKIPGCLLDGLDFLHGDCQIRLPLQAVLDNEPDPFF